MRIKITQALLLAMALTSLSGCGFWNKGTEYHLPDYYKTGLVAQPMVAGKTYYVNDLRCTERSDGCQPAFEPDTHRKYEKPYYLSK